MQSVINSECFAAYVCHQVTNSLMEYFTGTQDFNIRMTTDYPCLIVLYAKHVNVSDADWIDRNVMAGFKHQLGSQFCKNVGHPINFSFRNTVHSV